MSARPLCVLACQWCNDPKFWEWSNTVTHAGIFWYVKNKQDAFELITEICEVKSRKELDSNPEAAEMFNVCFRNPYMKWLVAEGFV